MLLLLLLMNTQNPNIINHSCPYVPPDKQQRAQQQKHHNNITIPISTEVTRPEEHSLYDVVCVSVCEYALLFGRMFSCKFFEWRRFHRISQEERERKREHLTESNNYIRLKPEREFTLPRDPRFLLIPLIPFHFMMTFETNTRV
jgi:hypothetical protein